MAMSRQDFEAIAHILSDAEKAVMTHTEEPDGEAGFLCAISVLTEELADYFATTNRQRFLDACRGKI